MPSDNPWIVQAVLWLLLAICAILFCHILIRFSVKWGILDADKVRKQRQEKLESERREDERVHQQRRIAENAAASLYQNSPPRGPHEELQGRVR